MNKEDLEKKGKEFVETVLKYSFSSMDTSTLANRFLKAFVAGAEVVLDKKEDPESIQTPTPEVQDKEPVLEEHRDGSISVPPVSMPMKEQMAKLIKSLQPKTEQKLVVMFGTEAPRDMEQYLSEGWLVKDMQFLPSVSKVLFLLERTN